MSLGCFPDDPCSDLGKILARLSFEGVGLANVGIECCLGVILFCLGRSPETGNKSYPSTRCAAPSGERLGFDPNKLAFCHAPSLRRPRWRSRAVDFKLRHYRAVHWLVIGAARVYNF
jgi:hypothetical protein